MEKYQVHPAVVFTNYVTEVSPKNNAHKKAIKKDKSKESDDPDVALVGYTHIVKSRKELIFLSMATCMSYAPHSSAKAISVPLSNIAFGSRRLGWLGRLAGKEGSRNDGTRRNSAHRNMACVRAGGGTVGLEACDGK